MLTSLDFSPIDGLSIPSFSFGRRIHSRTVTMTRTWTSRQTTGPDWLLWARRVPDGSVPHTAHASTEDLESAAEGPTRTNSVVIRDGKETDAPVLRQRDAADEETSRGHVPLGVAAAVEDESDVTDARDEDGAGNDGHRIRPTQTLRKRNTACESINATDGDVALAQVCAPCSVPGTRPLISFIARPRSGA